MRVSDIGNWAECEQRALFEGRSPTPSRHVAARVGTVAHATLAGVVPPIPPPHVIYDQITPIASHIALQAMHIATAAQRALDDRSWMVMSTELQVSALDVTGTLDLLVVNGGGARAVIDLKTGRVPGAAWLQVGGYLHTLGDPAVSYGGLLHVPRVPLAKGRLPTATLTIRDAAPLRDAWRVWQARIDSVQAGAAAVYSPGSHCHHCRHSDCPVRAEGS